MWRPTLSNVKDKRKKQPSIGSSDPHPSVTHSTPTVPSPKRLRLTAPLPSSSTSPIPSHTEQEPEDNDISNKATRNKSGKGRAVWSGIKSLLGTLESSSETFGPLKSAINGLNECVHIYENASKGRQDYDELRTRLEELLDDLNKHMATSIGPIMTASVKRLCVDIEREVKNVEEKHAKNTGRRLADAMDMSDDIIECYRRIQGHLERLTLNANITIAKAVNEQIAEARLARMCPALSAIYNSAEPDEIKRGGCSPGTRAAQIELLVEWARNPESGRTCWLNGMAGTGKTTIAYSVCERLETSYGLGASFFCSRVIPECRQVKHIIPTLAYQLARYSFPFRCALGAILESDPDAHTRTLKIQYQKLIVEPLSGIRGCLPSDFIVVIDALDECENENCLGQVLELFLSPVFALPVRFLVSSRPEPDIYRRMMGRIEGQYSARLVLHELDSNAVKSDIETYMRQELEHVPLTEDQWVGLLERCGLFIYASTTCRYLEQAYNMDTIDEALSIITGSSPSTVEHNDENAIDELYLAILTAALIKPGVSQANKRRMREVLETVICAAEPMTLDALGGLLGLGSTKQVEGLLQPLRSVLNIQPTTSLVTTLHASFQDFMFSPGRSKSYYCDPAVRHTALSKACLVTIDRVERKFNICDLASSHLFDNQVADLDQRVSKAISPALSYACRYWSTHLSFARHESELRDLVRNFFLARLLIWMEILNLTKRMRYGTEIIQEAKKWCLQQDGLDDVVKVAHDAWQFVSVFANHPVSQSTPHIYVSMLPFWPASRPISNAYMPRTAGMVEPTGTAISGRRFALLATWDVRNPQIEDPSSSLSQDGTRIAAKTEDGIVVLDTTTGESTYSLPVTDKVLSLAISPDNFSITFGCHSGSIKRWDLRKGHQVSELLSSQEFDSFITFMALSSDRGRVAIALASGDIYIYSLLRKERVHGPLKGHTSFVLSITFSPDGSYLASGSMDKTVRIWDATTGHMVGNALQGHTDWVRSVSYSPDGSYLASASDDGTIRVCDPHTGKTVLGPLQVHSQGVLSVAFSPNSRFIASGLANSTILVYDAQTGQKALGPLQGHTGPAFFVIFSPDNSRLFSRSSDHTIRAWNMQDLDADNDPLSSISSSLPSSIISVRYSHCGSRVVSGSSNGTIHIWDVQTGNMVLGPLHGHTDAIWSVDYSLNDAYIASASDDSTVQILDASNGNDIHGPIKGHAKAVRCVRFSPDSSVLASGSDDGTVRMWDVTSGQKVMTLLEGDNSIRSIGFSPDGRQVASCSGDGTLHVLDRQTGEAVVDPPQAHNGMITSVEFSPDGLQILSSSYDKTMQIWDIQPGRRTPTRHGNPLKHNNWVHSASFSPDGRLILSGCYDGMIQVWDVETGRLILGPLEGHTNCVGCVQFSPDGLHIVSCSYDDIRFWDVSSFQDRTQGNPVRDQGTLESPTPSIDNTSGSWSLDKDGWVVDRQKRLLVWVPSDLQSCPRLMPLNESIITDKPWLKLEFDGVLLGEGWTRCYRP